jgi:FkbM family methyltransferase
MVLIFLAKIQKRKENTLKLCASATLREKIKNKIVRLLQIKSPYPLHFMLVKDILRQLLIFLHWDVTKNLQYDRLTQMIMKKKIHQNSNCIDIGCHKGEMLHLMLKYSPAGKHFAFEPIPLFYNELAKKYQQRAHIFPYALSDHNGFATFQWVKNAPAYSGLKRRKYDIANPDIEEIEVEIDTLDDIIPPNVKIDFIKIDVEGAEFGVLKGAKNLLMKYKPTILFECGQGASDYYDTNPLDLYDFMTNEMGFNIFTLPAFVKNKPSLGRTEFVNCFNTNTEYYFVAI